MENDDPEASLERAYALKGCIGIIKAPLAELTKFMHPAGIGEGIEARYAYSKGSSRIEDKARLVFADDEGNLKGALKKICFELNLKALFKAKGTKEVSLIERDGLTYFGKWERGIVERYLELIHDEKLLFKGPVIFVVPATFMNRNPQLL